MQRVPGNGTCVLSRTTTSTHAQRSLVFRLGYLGKQAVTKLWAKENAILPKGHVWLQSDTHSEDLGTGKALLTENCFLISSDLR